MVEQPPQYSLQQLQDYTTLAKLISGDIKELGVTQPFLDWYNLQVKQVAKNLNIPTTKNYKEPKYLGIKLVVR